jgi:diaminopimelate epimerase
MKTYNFIKTSTAGNRTGFIVGREAYDNRIEVMKNILQNKNFEAEQYAFLWKKSNNCVMQTAGGELCGGAILASPVILGNYLGETNISSVDQKFTATISNRKQNQVYVRSTLPRGTILEYPIRTTIKIPLSINGFKVKLNGIAYFVTKERIEGKLNLEKFKKIDQQLAATDIPCLGIIQVLNNNQIKPTVWVKQVATIIEEQGCTTGAIAAQLAFPKDDGSWLQPSGKSINAKISNQIEIGANVETLADGILYLSDTN